MRAVEEGRRVLILVTYHHSRGDRSRGCSGFDFDLEAARSSAFAFRRQLESVFGTDHQIVYPIVIGIETDEDALTLHGDRGTAIDLAAIETGSSGEKRTRKTWSGRSRTSRLSCATTEARIS